MKASALHILQMEVPEYAKGTQDLWTVKLVKEAMVDAFRMLNRIGGKVGPGSLRAFWPQYAEPGDYPPEMTNVSPYRTRISVTRMEMVVSGWDLEGKHQPGWLGGPLDAAPELRDRLSMWIGAELKGMSTTDLCKRKRIALATFKRHRDRAAGMIAHRLNMLEVEVF